MKKTMKRLLLGMTMAALAVPVGCGARVSVLEEKGKSTAKGGDGENWAACDPQMLAAAQVGDGCSFASACSDYAGPQERIYTCQGGTLDIGTTDLLDFSGTTHPVGWTDCSSTLGTGHSGDTCTGTWSCAWDADDRCCIEFAWCRINGNFMGPTDQNVLYRARFCQEQCGNVPARPNDVAISGCLPTGILPVSGTPCTGFFVCWSSEDVTNASSIDIFDYGFDRLYWCRDGVVQSLSPPLP